MAKREIKYCRICLTCDEDNNIADSTSYIGIFIHIVNAKELKELWMCMWCRTILKRTQALIKLALQSEEMLNSQNVILVEAFQRKKPISLSYQTIEHIDYPPNHIENYEKEVIILNTANSLKQDNDMLNVIDNINEVYLENEFTDDNNIIDKYDNLKDYLIHEIEVNKNEDDIKIPELKQEYEFNMQQIRNENKTDIPAGNRKYKNEMKLNENKRDLKLDELKFEVRYLNLEEQLKELEMKKIKYKDMKYKCELCGVGFQTNDYFEEHKERHTELAGPHKCGICHLHFKTQLVLSQHNLSHRRLFTCTICGTKVSKWSNCGVHRQKCGGMVVHVKCGDCGKVFSDEHSLKVHKRIHNMKKKFTCEHCGRQFNTKQRLIVHNRSHTGEKPFSCVTCARCFTTRSNLLAHSTVHSDISTYYCVQCDTKYKTAKSLKRHLAECTRHTRDTSRMFSCKQCSKEFSTEKALQTHLARHSVNHQVLCPHCEKTFSNKSNLNKHLKCIHRSITT